MIWIYGVVAALLLGIGYVAWQRGNEIDDLNQKIGKLHTESLQLQGTNLAQEGTIAEQQKALNKWKGLADEATDKVAQAVAEVAKAKLERDRANAHMLELDAQDAARKECAAFLSPDIAGACPNIAADMVERAK